MPISRPIVSEFEEELTDEEKRRRGWTYDPVLGWQPPIKPPISPDISAWLPPEFLEQKGLIPSEGMIASRKQLGEVGQWAGFPVARSIKVGEPPPTGEEWALSAANLALLASGGVGGIIGGTAGKAVSAGLQAGAAGVFGAETAKHWEEMPEWQRAFSVVMTAAIGGVALKQALSLVPKEMRASIGKEVKTALASERGAIGYPEENPYMKMPIERVRKDADFGVKAAQEALAVREGKPIPAVPEVPKEPWQMTQKDFVSEMGKEPGEISKGLRPEIMPTVEENQAFHKQLVEKALAEGKPVPAEVLKDYPDLAAKAPEAKPLIDTSYKKRWDSDKLGVRVELAIKGKWITREGRLTRSGEKIAQTKWDDLSPAAQKVLKPLIDARYEVKFQEEITKPPPEAVPPVERVTPEVTERGAFAPTETELKVSQPLTKEKWEKLTSFERGEAFRVRIISPSKGQREIWETIPNELRVELGERAKTTAELRAMLEEAKTIPKAGIPQVPSKQVPEAARAGRIEIEQNLEYANKRIGEIRENLKARTGTKANRAWQNNELARFNQQKADYERLLKENNPEELSRYAPKGVIISPEIPVEAAKPPIAPPVKAEVPPIEPPKPTVGEIPKQPEFAGNIRLSKYPEELRQQLIDYAKQHPEEIDAARRGVRSTAQVQADASRLIEDLGGDYIRLVKKTGRAYNAEEMTALRGVFKDKIDGWLKATDVVKQSNSTENLLKLKAAEEEFTQFSKGVFGGTAEAGRALRSFRQEAFDAIRASDSRKMEELLKRIGGRENIENLVERIGQLDLDNPSQVARFLSQVSQKSKSEKFFGTLTWIFYNSILSGPKTHIINSLTNVGNAFASPVFRAGAVPYDILLSGAGKFRPRARFLNEVPADVVGAMQGIPEGARAWLYTWKHGISWKQASKWDFRQPAVAYTPVGRVIGSPLTGLESADAFMKQVNFRSALNATAHRMASQEKLAGQAFTEKVADLLSNPPLKLINEADKIAEYQLFRQKPDNFIQGLINLREKGVGGFKPLTFVIPFLRTPSNILKYGLERSPLGLLNLKLWKNIGAKNPEAADQLARVTIGSMLAAAIATYFAQGRITGAAPKDRAERDMFYRQGKQPFSIRIGDTWVSYQRLEPLNQTFSQVAAVVDAVKNRATKGVDQMASQAGSTIGQNLVSQTYLSGLSDLLDALNDPERNAANWLSKFSASLAVPFSAASRTAAQMFDPTVRQPSGIAEQIQANIPGLTQRVPAKITALGEETKRLVYPWFPIAISPVQEDALTNELVRLNKDVGFVGSVVANIKLDPDKQREYQEQAGQMTKSFLAKLIADPEYKRSTDVQKGYMIDQLISEAREKARKEILPTLDLPMAEKIRVEFSQHGASIAQFEKLTGLKWDDPKAETLITGAHRYLKSYWDIENKVWSGYDPRLKQLSDMLEKLSKTDEKKAKDFLFQFPEIMWARREVLLQKRVMRRNNPTLETILQLFY